MSALISVALSC